MAQRHKVYPVPTVNIPELHPGVWYRNYELYIGDGEVVDVRTRIRNLQEPEIVHAQVIDLNGQVAHHIPFEQIILCHDDINE